MNWMDCNQDQFLWGSMSRKMDGFNWQNKTYIIGYRNIRKNKYDSIFLLFVKI